MQNERKAFKNPLTLQVDPDLFRPATEEEKAQQIQTRESVSFMRVQTASAMCNRRALNFSGVSMVPRML